MRLSALLVALLGLVWLTGCQAGPPRLFTLASLQKGIAGLSVEGERPTVAMSSVTIPPLLERSHILVRNGASEIQLLDDRWAEPLADGLFRAMVDELQPLLPGHSMLAVPWTEESGAQYVTSIRIIQFDTRFPADGHGLCKLRAHWTLTAADGERLLARTELLTTRVESRESPAIVAAMSRIVARLSRSIAAEIRTRCTPGGTASDSRTAS